MEKMKLMLVDDEPRYLSTTQKLIAKQGIDVVTASSGQQALEILKTKGIHVVILDVKMPGMDGNQTLKAIKEKYPMTEVIMLTGHGTMDSAIDGLKSGAADYLIKPADPSHIIEKAKEAFEKIQKMEEKIRSAQTKKFMRSPREILKGEEQDF
ncbi:MAG: two-component system response regulator [Desulfobacterales bacterium]|nr:MAG: two-component system response regulator [Desulfobacterales bacterium]